MRCQQKKPQPTVTARYASPLGEILLAADSIGLSGLWFEGQRHFPRSLASCQEEEAPVLTETKLWLDLYFSGENPAFTPPLHLSGTAFQRQIWHILATIPYGATTTYGKIAAQAALANGLPHMSAQAVGGAVGRNPVSIIVPCHRVLGSGGQLTGYAGGLERKAALLRLEGILEL